MSDRSDSSTFSKQTWRSPFHQDRFQQYHPHLGHLQHLGVGPLPILKAETIHPAEIT